MRTVGSSGAVSSNTARPSGGTEIVATISGSPCTSNTTVRAGRRARLLPDDVAEALRRDAAERKIRDRTFEISGTAERFANVLVVIPAVEDADLHEHAVRAGTFGCEALAFPVVFRHSRHRHHAARRHAAKLVEHFLARAVAVGRDPLFVRTARCRCARAVRRRAGSVPSAGCSPSSMRSVPIMCDTLILHRPTRDNRSQDSTGRR